MTAILASRSAIDRSTTDFYPTPPEVTVALARWMAEEGILRSGQFIWEPACGQGHMAEVFRELGHPVIATDLFDDSYGEGGVDFLTTPARYTDFVITNPPFKVASQFAQRIAELNVGGALLLKSQFWHAATRRALFAELPPYAVLPITWRPDFLMGSKSSSPTMDVLWTVWLPGHTGPTKYAPLARPEKGAR